MSAMNKLSFLQIIQNMDLAIIFTLKIDTNVTILSLSTNGIDFSKLQIILY